ncbi:MAG: T9SS type A sorting domain-containing protein [Flavobacteriales bacterium]|nr:T9SS type A sorting domain-containing protein [Flavobacteriales bacterium]
MKRIEIITMGLLCFGIVQAQTFDRQVFSSNGGYATNGNLSLEWTLGEIAVKTYTNGNLIVTQGFHQSVDNCQVFETAPVDLTKSFDPVNGVKDRIQLKFYKASPFIKYSDEDAAACDIKFWKKRVLDPSTGNPTGPVISNPDTIQIIDAKKYQANGTSPREIFKWPIKYRADGVNNNKRVEPNFRYEWQVRCACEHGEGIESPWSEIRLFNTPDFDPSTGIFTPGGIIEDPQADKGIDEYESLFQLFPNPTSDLVHLTWIDPLDQILGIRILDATGKLVYNSEVFTATAKEFTIDMTDFVAGNYYFILSNRKGMDIMQKQIAKLN